ncbi:MAG TPA: hypothetical protein VF121_05240 [Thermoanaerobaculia bacterium]|nr:hypothetical protein [Thermoanaerobaculia bacterium]
MTDFSPPPLSSLVPVLAALPDELLPWITEKHVAYLDDRIHKIEVLTDYLAGCDAVAGQREEFVTFVDSWTQQEPVDLPAYMGEYRHRFATVRSSVEAQCERIMLDDALWASSSELLRFWRDFALVNETDSLHGMFLTSGRWYVNVMLPIVRELVFCTLPDEIHGEERPRLAYWIARRVITPRFAEAPSDYAPALERRFAALFIPVLQFYDRKLLFLFQQMEKLPLPAEYTLVDFVRDVGTKSTLYRDLLEAGIYPPFAWHELHASRRPRRPGRAYEEAVRPLLSTVSPPLRSRVDQALAFLSYMKDFELNYNNYNYKGKFGLISKWFYWRTNQALPEAERAPFLDAILGDRFFEALDHLEQVWRP